MNYIRAKRSEIGLTACFSWWTCRCCRHWFFWHFVRVNWCSDLDNIAKTATGIFQKLKSSLHTDSSLRILASTWRWFSIARVVQQVLHKEPRNRRYSCGSAKIAKLAYTNTFSIHSVHGWNLLSFSDFIVMTLTATAWRIKLGFSLWALNSA